MSRFLAIATSLLLIASAALADENPHGRGPGDRPLARHYVVQMEHALRPAEQADLAGNGIDVQHVMTGNRYLVTAADTAVLRANPNVRSVDSIAPERKLDRLAWRAAASASPYVTLNVRFHDDVTFDDALRAVDAAGGTIATPLPYAYDQPQRLQVRIAPGAVARLAADDHVLGLYGRLKAAPVNAVASQLSHVTPLFTAPYNLDGSGVVLSLFEAPETSTTSAVAASHKEFGGRVVSNDTNQPDTHATHVAGTMIAAGLDPNAKGMAPAAIAQDFRLDDNTVWTQKEKTLPPLGVVADNNSWGFQLGWQFDSSSWVWFGAIEYFGAYDGFYSAPYDKIAHEAGVNVLFIHSAGNDGDAGLGPGGVWVAHKHVDDNFDTIKDETFCYSQNGTGTDCPLSLCTAGKSAITGEPHCETVKHPVYGPYTTISFIASEKNVLAVGAVDQSLNIASFSSRGPALDGRIKPDVVAKGVHQYSTMPNNTYGTLSGTSMSSPVVTGISALLTQQWRKTFGGATPSPQMLKTLLIAGADDIGNPGPDYTFGFGLVNAQASVDTIIADNKTGARIRTGSLAQGDTVQIPLTVSSAGKLRVVLSWSDPEVLLTADQVADKTLVNDLDLKVIDAGGATVLPYVLDVAHPDAVATRGVNTVDNTEEVEIANAPAGAYKVVLSGTKIASGANQDYVLVANNTLGSVTPPCGDPYEPNDTAAAAFKYLISGDRITAKTCSATDLDFYVAKPTAAGPLSVTVAASDTPLRVTISGNGLTPVTADIAAGQSSTLFASATLGEYTIEVQPNGAIGSNATYTLTPSFNFAPVPRTRRASH